MYFGSIGGLVLFDMAYGSPYRFYDGSISAYVSDLLWVHAVPFWGKTCVAFFAKLVVDRALPRSEPTLSRWVACLIFGFVALDVMQFLFAGSLLHAVGYVYAKTLQPAILFAGHWLEDVSYPVHYASMALSEFWAVTKSNYGNQFLMADEMPKFFFAILLVNALAYPFARLADQ